LRVAIISTVQNVRLQRRDRPTDDASTRRWRGSQQANNDTFITSLATLSLSNKQVNACPVLYIFAVLSQQKNIEIGSDLTELQSNVQCHISYIMAKCRFQFFQVRCAHKSGDVTNFYYSRM